MQSMIAETDIGIFEADVLRQETQILGAEAVEIKLGNALCSPERLRDFAEAFYFIRYNFCRLNCIVGARSQCHERYWAGLVRNLVEEFGDFRGPTHNELYRRFLRTVNAAEEEKLSEPEFARIFNEEWQEFCRSAPYMEALAAIAVYEILDGPDYAMLFRVMQKAGVGGHGLTFFSVHAEAKHFELFSGLIADLIANAQGRRVLSEATNFVLSKQKTMWNGLLAHLEA